ncbi:MAG TPA: hypothetical protein VM406_04765 [Noviherbaspirillum sp.]|nr:hypothetical protein [Noviherbaspirillum sp.]
MKKVVIKFTATVSPYQTGEIAGFDEETAKKYIAAKLAVEYKADKKSADDGAGDGSQK